MKISLSLKTIIRVDALAAFLSAVGVFVLKDWMNGFFHFPGNMLPVLSGISMCYACFSFSLAVRRSIPLSLARFLVAANALYAMACIVLLLCLVNTAAWPGLVYLLTEAGFVAGLAIVEWRIIKNKL